MASSFNRIAIIGVGLIGGSLGLAIRRAYPRAKVVGVDSPTVLRKAHLSGAITGSNSLAAAVRDADLVILATPTRTILRNILKISKLIKPGTTVTDVGSVKSGTVALATSVLPRGVFIGGHPMAGSERSGIGAADPLLFENALYVLTPDRSVSQTRLRRLGAFLKGIGARVAVMDASVHDRVAAVVSHLPQLTAVALMNVAGIKDKVTAKHVAMAAGGFRDMTRIASSPFGMWEEIFEGNAKEVRKALKLMVKELMKYDKVLGSSPKDLHGSFSTASRSRSRIPSNMKGFLHPLSHIHVFLQDKPGSLQRMTGVLARHKISIKDLELVKVREGMGGTFKVWFENGETVGKARKSLRKAGFKVALATR